MPTLSYKYHLQHLYPRFETKFYFTKHTLVKYYTSINSTKRIINVLHSQKKKA